MERRNLWLATGLTLLLLTATGAFRYAAIGAATMAEAVNGSGSLLGAEAVGVESTVADSELDRIHAEREAAYQQQIVQLNQLLLDRQTTYQTQTEELKTRFAMAQAQQEQLAAQEYAYGRQVSELASVHNERQVMFQEQLQATVSQYDGRYAELTTRLSEVQTKLAEANTLLNR